MAYDPALTSFIIVGVVGGVAVVMNASAGWEITHELARASDRWTSPYVIRRYRNDSTAPERASKEAAVLQAHGYEPVSRPGEGSDLGAERRRCDRRTPRHDRDGPRRGARHYLPSRVVRVGSRGLSPGPAPNGRRRDAASRRGD